MAAVEMTLSVCIPTYNRGALLADRVRAWLAVAPDDLEIVVTDNVSDNGTYEALAAIDDPQFTLVRNETNVGSFENQLVAFGVAKGRYVMQLMDKDELQPEGIVRAVEILRAHEVACGAFELNHDPDAPSAVKSISGYSAFAAHGFTYAHPSGVFFNAGVLKAHGIVGRLQALDQVSHPFSTDYLVSLCLAHGPFLDVCQSFIRHNLPPYEGIERSFSYKDRRTFYFMPDFVWREFVAYLAFMRDLRALSGLSRLRLIFRLVRKTVFPHATSTYRWTLGSRVICDWYGVPEDLREAELRRDTEGDFFAQVRAEQGLSLAERLAVRLAAWTCLGRARRQRRDRSLRRLLNRTYDFVCSFGCDCGCAWHLDTHDLRTASYPLDWIGTEALGPDGTARLVANNFAGFLRLENLRKSKAQPTDDQSDKDHEFYTDVEQHIVFAHEIPTGRPAAESYPEVKAKYDRRIQRFYKSVQQARSVLFARWSWREHPTEDVIRRTAEILRKKFPDQKIDLLFMRNVDVGGIAAREINEGIYLVDGPFHPKGGHPAFGDVAINAKVFKLIRLRGKRRRLLRELVRRRLVHLASCFIFDHDRRHAFRERMGEK